MRGDRARLRWQLSCAGFKKDIYVTATLRRRLLFINNSSTAFLSHHLPLAEAMREEMETHVAVACDKFDDARHLEKRGIIVHPIRWSRKTVNPLRVALETLAVRKIIASVNPDVVNAINIKCLLVAALAMRFPTIAPSRLVGTITGLGYMFSGDSLQRRLLRCATMTTLRRVLPELRHTLVFSNTDDRRRFASYGIGEGYGNAVNERIRVIPVPGVDTSMYAFLPEPPEGFRVILPARMLWEKGVGEFVAAADILRARGIQAEFVLAGGVDTGNPVAIDERQLREWNTDRKVRWIGHCNNMPALLASANAVCLPSYYGEGFPRSLGEAMSCGRAVVTTDVPGCRDAVLDGDDRVGTGGAIAGLLIPPRNAEALANALAALHANPKKRAAMGHCGREAAAGRFSLEAVTAAMKNVLWDAAAS